MEMRIALAGNPNCGKTTLFNALTGSNQFVGNWPGVTVEKKEGKLKNREGVIVTDLPGIYSLSPYTPEERVARNYLIGERPDAILNIVDGTNLERNLYLTTQLTEIGIPVVVAINMMDVVRKNGDKIDTAELSKALSCPVCEISALKIDGIYDAVEAAVQAAQKGKTVPMHIFSGAVEHAIAHIEEAALHDLPEAQQRWYAIKIFERDERVLEKLAIPEDKMKHIESDIAAAEAELDDDADSIIIGERYGYIGGLMKRCYQKKNQGALTVSDKIDKVVTNRWAALPIFAVIMFLVYFISVTTVGAWATDWTNNGLFGEGFHLFGIGQSEYEDAAEEFGNANTVIEGMIYHAEQNGISLDELASKYDPEAEDFDIEAGRAALLAFAEQFKETGISFPVDNGKDGSSAIVNATYGDIVAAIDTAYGRQFVEPDPADYKVWIPGIPVLVGKGLDAINSPAWLSGLILDGIVAGVGAVLGFVPQMFILFIFLAFLEACGYMSRIAFVLDRIFRKFGLSGKSFIPMLIGTGCGVPGIMASRTIENESDRRMTIMTTTFIPCGAKLPFIAMIAGAIFGGAWWVAPVAYFLGVLAVIVSGVMLKKTRLFAGEPTPFVMELPAYHLPTVSNVLRSMWERGWSFIKKAGTVILLSSVVIWFFTYFGFVDGRFMMLSNEQLNSSILAYIGKGLAWLFVPLGFGTWQATVASLTGLLAKENIVSSMSIFYSTGVGTLYGNLSAVFTSVSGLSFLIFNLLCAPCVSAMGAMKREMNSGKWTAFAIAYQCVFAYTIALIVNQIGNLFMGNGNALGVIVAILLIAALVYMMVRPYKEKKKA